MHKTATRCWGIFGNDLFEAALLNRPECEDGTATAISTFWAIFTGVWALVLYPPRHLAGLYSAVRACLASPYHSPTLIVMLQRTEALFTTDFAGARVLVLYYVRAIESIMTAHLDKQGMGAAAIEHYRLTWNRHCCAPPRPPQLLPGRTLPRGGTPGVDPSLPRWPRATTSSPT